MGTKLTGRRAVAGSVMLSNTGGSIADMTAPKYLPLALSVISFGPLNGPVLGPLIVRPAPLLIVRSTS